MRFPPMSRPSLAVRLCCAAAAVGLLFHAAVPSGKSQARYQTKANTSPAADARPPGSRKKSARPWETPSRMIQARGTAPDCIRSPRLRGTLIQPWLLADWSREQLWAELEYMRGACVDQLIVQWTADSKSRTTYYPTALPDYKPASDRD